MPIPDDFNPNLAEPPEDDEEMGVWDEWVRTLEEDIIQGEFGYEPGEFTVYQAHWRPLFDEGLTPREAWQRALHAHRSARTP